MRTINVELTKEDILSMLRGVRSPSLFWVNKLERMRLGRWNQDWTWFDIPSDKIYLTEEELFELYKNIKNE